MSKEQSFIQPEDPDAQIRPKRLEDFIGQPEMRRRLRVYLDAAKDRGHVMDHVLFHGNPGLGKTTLANIMAYELGVNIITTSGPVLLRGGDLASILSNLSKNDILFIDEIHRMPKAVEEVLYSAMEDFTLDLVVGQGAGARTVKISIEPFTLIGATTRMGLLSSPLRDRFGIIEHLEFYSPEDLASVVLRSAQILGQPISEEGAFEIGRRSRGTPRIANRLLRRVRDFAGIYGEGHIDKVQASRALDILNIDELGLDEMDRKILKVIIENYNGGPVGLKTLSTACSEDQRTLEEIYEPYLIQCGMLKLTPKGRIATSRAFLHMKNNLLSR